MCNQYIISDFGAELQRTGSGSEVTVHCDLHGARRDFINWLPVMFRITFKLALQIRLVFINKCPYYDATSVTASL